MSAVSFSYDSLNMMITIAHFMGSASGAMDSYCSDLMNGLFHPLNNLSACEPYGNSHVSNAGCNVQNKVNVLNDNANYWNAMANSLQSYLAFMQSQDEQVAHLFNDAAASYLPPVLRNFYGLTAEESLEYIIEQIKSFPEYAEQLADFLGLDKAKEFVLRFFSSEKLSKANLGPRDLNMYRHPMESERHFGPSTILLGLFWFEHPDTAEVIDRYTESFFSHTVPHIAKDFYEAKLYSFQNRIDSGLSYLSYLGNYNLENASTIWDSLEILDDARRDLDQTLREDWGHPLDMFCDYLDFSFDTWDDLSDLYSESYDNISDMRHEFHLNIINSFLDSAATEWDYGIDSYTTGYEWAEDLANDLSDKDHLVFSLGFSISGCPQPCHTTTGNFYIVFDPVAYFTDPSHSLAFQHSITDGDSFGGGFYGSVFFNEAMTTGIPDSENGYSQEYGITGGLGPYFGVDFSLAENEDGGINWLDSITLSGGVGAGGDIHDTSTTTYGTFYPIEFIESLFN